MLKHLSRFCKMVLSIFLVLILVVPVSATPRSHTLSPESYVYNRAGAEFFMATPAPAPYRFSRSVTAQDIGVDSLINLMEIEYHDGRFFITNGASLVVTDSDFNAITILEGIDVDGQWENFTPLNGIFITRQGEIYVAEPGAGRVLHFDSDLNLVRVLGRPEGLTLSEDVPYQPIKVAVDHHGRIYVISNNVFEGIVEINADGTFNRYFGVVEISFSTAERFWRALQTPAQRVRSRLTLPVNFTNLTVDRTGFVFATISDAGTDVGVKKLNARGENILRRPEDEHFDHFVGDLNFNTFGIGVPFGPSTISIVQVTDFGVYYAFDSNRNRVFAYDQDGHMLFAFGGTGTREGTTDTVTGMTMTENRLVFADRGNRSIEVFERTVYGNLVLSAAERQFNNDYMGAAHYWQQVLNLNPFFQYAYVGVGIALFRQGYFEEAMEFFRHGQDVAFFSMAYQQVRADNMYENFNTIMTVIVMLLAAYILYKIARKIWTVKKQKGAIA